MTELIFKGLTELAQKSSELGDRTQYIGASDIGGCPRKVVLKKKHPPVYDLASLIRFRRGHLAEGILREALDQEGVAYLYQEELSHPEAPFLAHPDFMFPGKGTMGILEVKCTDGIPDSPYDSWLDQLHFQMGLAALKYRVRVKGAIFSIDLNAGQVEVFSGYYFDPEIFSRLVSKAEMLWDFLVSDDEDAITTEKSPLCAWCHYRAGCPAFKVGEDVPAVPIENEVQQYLGLKEQQKDINTQIKKLSGFLRQVVQELNPDDGKVRAGTFLLRLSNRKRVQVDQRKLQEEHPDIYTKYTRQSSYSVLLVD